MKTLFTSVALICASINTNAQSLGDMVGGLKGKKTEQNSTPAQPVNVALGANQFEMIEAFLASGTKTASATAVATGLQPSQKKLEDVMYDIQRNDKNQIIGFKTKLGVENNFKIQDAPHPIYYRGERGGALYFIGNTLIYSDDPNIITDPQHVRNYSSIWGSMELIMSTDKAKLKTLTIDDVRTIWANYLEEAGKVVQTFKDAEKALSDKAEAEKRAKFTTQGRSVVSITIQAASTVLKQGSTQKYDIVAKLKDGTTISTAAGGYHDEFEIEVSGLPVMYKSSFGELKTVANGTINVPDNAVINGDQVVLKIKSKYYPTVTGTLTFTMDYSQPWTLDYNGQSQSTACHQSIPGAVRVEIKGVKHGVTKKDLVEMKVYAVKNNNLLRHIRVEPTAPVNLWLNGARGWTGTLGESCSRAPKDGSAGGDVTVIIDPSVKSYVLNISNKGGASGGAYSSAGRDGKVEKVNQAVGW